MDPLGWIDEALDELNRQHLLRALPPAFGAAGATVHVSDKPVISFASNDYLGLAADRRLAEAAAEELLQHGVGRGASPLVSGRSTVHDRLEHRLAELTGTERALLFPTSYAANTGIIPAVVGAEDAIYADAKNHASIIDGCRLSRAEKHVYPHADVEHLEQLLRKGADYRRRLIVTDTLFSMDGDLAPLPQLARLARKYQAMLMVDEAHALGVFGERGGGVVEHFGADDDSLAESIHIRVGSFGKALGAAGGFVCGSESLITWLSNRARPFVFSTAPPAAISTAVLAALDVLEQEPGQGKRLLSRAQHFRQRLHSQGWNTGKSVSQITPVILGSAERTMRVSRALWERGLWVPGIRPPSVPEGESLLRIGLTVAHAEPMLEELFGALADVAQ